MSIEELRDQIALINDHIEVTSVPTYGGEMIVTLTVGDVVLWEGRVSCPVP